eukprot:scaffold14_cov380-Prasinococcus_capsulatus_cf.AAC.4
MAHTAATELRIAKLAQSTLLHAHSRVRIAGIDAMRCLIQSALTLRPRYAACSKAILRKQRQLQLYGLVLQDSFLEGLLSETLAGMWTDNAVSVREHWYKALGSWSAEMMNSSWDGEDACRDQSAHGTLMVAMAACLLVGKSDSSETVQSCVHTALSSLPMHVEKDDQCNILAQVVKGCLGDVQDWQVDRRRRATKVIFGSLQYRRFAPNEVSLSHVLDNGSEGSPARPGAQSKAMSYMVDVVNVLRCASWDEDAQVRETAESCVKLVAQLTPFCFWLEAVVPTCSLGDLQLPAVDGKCNIRQGTRGQRLQQIAQLLSYVPDRSLSSSDVCHALQKMALGSAPIGRALGESIWELCRAAGSISRQDTVTVLWYSILIKSGAQRVSHGEVADETESCTSADDEYTEHDKDSRHIGEAIIAELAHRWSHPATRNDPDGTCVSTDQRTPGALGSPPVQSMLAVLSEDVLRIHFLHALKDLSAAQRAQEVASKWPAILELLEALSPIYHSEAGDSEHPPHTKAGEGRAPSVEKVRLSLLDLCPERKLMQYFGNAACVVHRKRQWSKFWKS